MRFKELLRPAEQAPAPVEIKGRRRPGRNEQVSPHLIPLLRNPATVDIPAPLPVEIDPLPLGQDRAFIKGILVALALSVPLWAGIIGAVRAVLR